MMTPIKKIHHDAEQLYAEATSLIARSLESRFKTNRLLSSMAVITKEPIDSNSIGVVASDVVHVNKLKATHWITPHDRLMDEFLYQYISAVSHRYASITEISNCPIPEIEPRLIGLVVQIFKSVNVGRKLLIESVVLLQSAIVDSEFIASDNKLVNCDNRAV